MWGWLQQFQFEYPLRLSWLAAIPLLAYFALRGSVTLSRWRRSASLVCRWTLVAVLVLAFAGIEQRWQSARRWIISARCTRWPAA